MEDWIDAIMYSAERDEEDDADQDEQLALQQYMTPSPTDGAVYTAFSAALCAHCFLQHHVFVLFLVAWHKLLTPTMIVTSAKCDPLHLAMNKKEQFDTCFEPRTSRFERKRGCRRVGLGFTSVRNDVVPNRPAGSLAGGEKAQVHR